MTITAAKRLEELKRIYKEKGGILRPEDVVEAAEPESSPLHDAFEWDNTKAAQRYRLHQARCLIKVTVQTIEAGDEKRTVRAFVALRKDRKGGEGYRSQPDLLKTADGRKAILDTALWELRAFKAKYADLKELDKIFKEIDKL